MALGLKCGICCVQDDGTTWGAKSNFEDGMLTIGSDMKHRWDGVMLSGLSRLVWIVTNG